MYSEDIISTQANIGFMHEDRFMEAYNESIIKPAVVLSGGKQFMYFLSSTLRIKLTKNP